MDEIYRSFISYISKMIDEIGLLIMNKNKMSNEEFLTNISKIFLNPQYRIHLGIFIILLSFFLYIIDTSTE